MFYILSKQKYLGITLSYIQNKYEKKRLSETDDADCPVETQDTHSPGKRIGKPQ